MSACPTPSAWSTSDMHDAEAGELHPDWAAKLDAYRARFEEAMNDDFNTPRAIAVLFDLSREVNTFLNSGQPESQGTLAAIGNLYQVLGAMYWACCSGNRRARVVPGPMMATCSTAWSECSSTSARRPARPATGPRPTPSATNWPHWASPLRTAQRGHAGGRAGRENAGDPLRPPTST